MKIIIDPQQITINNLQALLEIVDQFRANVSCMISEVSTGEVSPRDASKFCKEGIKEIQQAWH